MLFNDTTREIPIIEAYYKDKLVGKFVDMHTLRNRLGILADKVSCRFNVIINEKTHETLFWNLIKTGFILEKQKVK